MRTWFLLKILVYLSSCAVAQNDESAYFVDSKEWEVQAVATKALENVANRCDILQTCQNGRTCSRRACYPFKSEDDEMSCIYVYDNTLCQNRTGPICNSVRANEQRSYVRIPPLNFTYGGSVEDFLGSTICTQRELDSKFIEINKNITASKVPAYMYFGAVDGTMRYYPGREITRDMCDAYDPRVRPWFMGAISVVKDLVIILDTGSYMARPTPFLFGNFVSSLDVFRSMVQRLSRTVTPNDRVTIIPITGAASPVAAKLQFLVPPGGLDPSQPVYQRFVESIASISAPSPGSDDDEQASNFAAGFRETLSTFNDSDSPDQSLKIGILLTDGQYPPSAEDVATALEFQKQRRRLFVYELDSHSAGSDWSDLACQVGGYNEKVDVLEAVTNPLFSFIGYYAFLARSRIDANGGRTPFWQPKYVAASGLGEIITVAYPAMSADGRLIGVAGIDVQINVLDPGLQFDIEQTLQDRLSSMIITQNPNGADISNCTGYQTASDCGNIQDSFVNVLCPKDIDADAETLSCCGQCNKRGSTSSGNLSQTIAIWISVGIGISIVILLIPFIKIRYFPKRVPPKSLALSHRLPPPDWPPGLEVYTYEELRAATNDFHDANFIGEGAFGKVYTANLREEIVAVKRLSRPADRAQDFQNELRTLVIASNHANLVELKGGCLERTECFLVYEFVEDGDLHHRLWPENTDNSGIVNEGFLTWTQRKKIATGIANGLVYLHHGLEPEKQIFHLDIKPRNILLGRDFTPKIADFGISQLYEPGYTLDVVSIRGGTFGYIAEEVFQGARPNSKLDVFSFGMVLLQLVCGRQINDPDCRPYLLRWARDQYQNGHRCRMRLIDPELMAAAGSEGEVGLTKDCMTIVTLALRCLSDRPELRPDMREVLAILVSEITPEDLEYESSGFIEVGSHRCIIM